MILKRMDNGFLINKFFVSIVLVMIVSFRGSVGGAADEVSNELKLKGKFKEVLLESKKQLGDLEPWRKTIFDTEILTVPQRFLGDYRVQGTTIEGSADIKSIRQVMAFHATLSAGLGTSPKAVVVATASAGCDVCVRALPNQKKWMIQSIERRGFLVDTVERENSSVESLMNQKNAKAYFKLILSQKLPEGPDDPHADDKYFQVQINTMIKGAGELSRTWNSEFLENDKFENAVPKLWIEAWSFLGSSQASIQLKGSSSQSEVLVAVSGVRDFNHFEKLKKNLTEILKEYGRLLERKKQQGKVVFLLKTDQTVESIGKVLGVSENRWRELGISVEAREP